MSDNKIKTYIIYAYFNLITRKYVYVGQTTRTLEERADSNLYAYRKRSKYFGPEIEKYGPRNFEAEVLAEVSNKEYADILEWYYTVKLKTQYPYGCNEYIGTERTSISKKVTSETTKAAMGRPEVREKTQKNGERSRLEKVREKNSESNKNKHNDRRQISELYHQDNMSMTWNQFQRFMRNKYETNYS